MNTGIFEQIQKDDMESFIMNRNRYVRWWYFDENEDIYLKYNPEISWSATLGYEGSYYPVCKDRFNTPEKLLGLAANLCREEWPDSSYIIRSLIIEVSNEYGWPIFGG